MSHCSYDAQGDLNCQEQYYEDEYEFEAEEPQQVYYETYQPVQYVYQNENGEYVYGEGFQQYYDDDDEEDDTQYVYYAN